MTITHIPGAGTIAGGASAPCAGPGYFDVAAIAIERDLYRNAFWHVAELFRRLDEQHHKPERP